MCRTTTKFYKWYWRDYKWLPQFAFSLNRPGPVFPPNQVDTTRKVWVVDNSHGCECPFCSLAFHVHSHTHRTNVAHPHGTPMWHNRVAHPHDTPTISHPHTWHAHMAHTFDTPTRYTHVAHTYDTPTKYHTHVAHTYDTPTRHAHSAESPALKISLHIKRGVGYIGEKVPVGKWVFWLD
jgi:hypothetical protein